MIVFTFTDLLESSDVNDMKPVKKAKDFFRSCMDTGMYLSCELVDFSSIVKQAFFMLL